MGRASSICDCEAHCWAALDKGLVALADPEFLHVLSRWNWRVKVCGARRYVVRTHNELVSGVRRSLTLRLHSIVIPTSAYLIDHRNGNGLDNRSSNLRLATYSENAQNQSQRRRSSSKFKGVSRRGNHWVAVITKNGTQKYLGRFSSEEGAARAYDREAAALHGEFSRLNFAADQRERA